MSQCDVLQPVCNTATGTFCFMPACLSCEADRHCAPLHLAKRKRDCITIMIMQNKAESLLRTQG